ncbi:hypothetical protein PPUJ20028_33930 [Pseudomonas putida]|nr:hypothetical protein PPUJ20028_33930 [Pseudomonas putida]
MNISTKSLVHHWSKAGGPGQIPGYATHLEKVAKLSNYLKYGGHAAVGVGGASSYLNVQEVCRAGESGACKKVRFTETGSFAGGLGGGLLGAWGGGGAATALCGVFAVGTGGLGVPVCGIVIVGASSAAGSIGLGAFGEKAGEVLYEVIDD